MKKTDIGVCLAMYAVCAFFLSMTLKLPEAAQIYPLCIIALLAGLTTLHVLNMIISAFRFGVESGLEDFKNFIPSQFFTLFIMIVLYLVAMPHVGFYISSVVFMALSLIFLRVKIWQIILAEIACSGIVRILFLECSAVFFLFHIGKCVPCIALIKDMVRCRVLGSWL